MPIIIINLLITNSKTGDNFFELVCYVAEKCSNVIQISCVPILFTKMNGTKSPTVTTKGPTLSRPP